MRLFIIGAIVLIVLGIIAAASSTGQLWSTWWYTWLMAALLSFFVDIFLAEAPIYSNIRIGRRDG